MDRVSKRTRKGKEKLLQVRAEVSPNFVLVCVCVCVNAISGLSQLKMSTKEKSAMWTYCASFFSAWECLYTKPWRWKPGFFSVSNSTVQWQGLKLFGWWLPLLPRFKITTIILLSLSTMSPCSSVGLLLVSNYLQTSLKIIRWSLGYLLNFLK